MAKRTQSAKPAKTASKTARQSDVAHPTAEDFERARAHLRQRANALILELATRYHAGKSEELTAILNAIDCATELERMEQRPPAAPT